MARLSLFLVALLLFALSGCNGSKADCDCAAGAICVDGTCRNLCADDTDCDADEYCDPNGSCGPTVCGDGMRQGGEECDNGQANHNGAGCTASCTIARCGDGLVFTGVEECDDGNSDLTDGCPDGDAGTCEEAVCGDGFVWLGHEPCDEQNTVNTDACLVGCVAATCGDGHIWDGVELCDDGNTTLTDGCPDGPTGSCEPATCGDGYIDATSAEVCDDGNQNNTDACPDGPGGTCLEAYCGDGFVQQTVDECDDANADDNDDCLNTCEDNICGDGIVNLGVEGCDGVFDNGVCDQNCAAHCTTPFEDCNESIFDGCEANPTNDPENCGPCGYSCLGGACADGVCQPILVATASWARRIAVDETTVYWSGNSGVESAPKDGSGGATTLIANYVDSINSEIGRYMVLTDNAVVALADEGCNNDCSLVYRVKDGSTPAVALYIETLRRPQSLAVFGNDLYWFEDYLSSTVEHGTASGVAAVSLAMVNWVEEMVHDGSDLYYVDGNSDRALWKLSTTDPSPTPIQLSTGNLIGYHLAVDATDAYVATSSEIVRVPKIGGDPVSLAPLGSGASRPEIAVDATHVYWANGTGFYKVVKTGGATETVLAVPTNTIRQRFAIDDNFLYFTYTTGGIYRVRK